MIVDGIGAGAIMKLTASGIRVYKAEAGTVATNVAGLREGTLIALKPESGYRQQGACNH